MYRLIYNSKYIKPLLLPCSLIPFSTYKIFSKRNRTNLHKWLCNPAFSKLERSKLMSIYKHEKHAYTFLGLLKVVSATSTLYLSLKTCTYQSMCRLPLRRIATHIHKDQRISWAVLKLLLPRLHGRPWFSAVQIRMYNPRLPHSYSLFSTQNYSQKLN